MRAFRLLAAATAIAGLLTGSAVTAASAAATHSAGTAHATAAVRLVGGTTSVTTASGIAAALLKNGIVPIATWPGSQSLRLPRSGPEARFWFPVTGGRVSLSPLGGHIDHRGGILFFNARNGTRIEVSNFIISLTRRNLTAIVNGNPKARVPLFNLVLTHAKVAAGKHAVVVRGVGLTLTKVAARALNATLGTRLFSAGLGLGTAQTVLRF